MVSFRGLIQNSRRASPPLSYGSPPPGRVISFQRIMTQMYIFRRYKTSDSLLGIYFHTETKEEFTALQGIHKKYASKQKGLKDSSNVR